MDFRSQIILLLLINSVACLMWERLHCSSDSKQEMPEGRVSDIGRFPWLGLVQHSFYIAGKVHYAVTGAVLVHPAFAIAAAEDIAKINPNELTNNTKLILWASKTQRFAVDVKDYMLHPEFHDKVTYATIALLDLVAWGESISLEWRAPVLPICMPYKGSGTFDSIYAVKMNDETGSMEKEIIKMNYVDNQDCEEFYYKAQLTYGKMNPVNPLCAVSQFAKKPCVWDGGTALITRQSWGFWKLIGFAVRGPGCGAPTRFLNMHDYLPWINDVITRIPLEDFQDVYKLGLRRLSPIKLIMYKADIKMPKGEGQCGRKERGNILYKDSSELLTNKNFVQGFFFVVITQLAEFRCAEVTLDVASRTNAAIWVEHNCHADVTATEPSQKRPSRERFPSDPKVKEKWIEATGHENWFPTQYRMTCFVYYKSAVYIELRFYFSFKALIEVAMFGSDEKVKIQPNPFQSSQHTTQWWPTPDRLKFWYFVPANLWWYDL